MLDISNDEGVMQIAWEKVELKASLPDEMTDFYDQHGAVPGIQLGHSGRKARRFRPWRESATASSRPAGDRPSFGMSSMAWTRGSR